MGRGYFRSRDGRPAGIQRNLVQRTPEPGRDDHREGRGPHQEYSPRHRGPPARLLSSVSGRARSQRLRPDHRRPLHARRRHRILSEEARMARHRSDHDARRAGAVDPADAENLEQQGTGRLRRSVLEGKADGAGNSAGPAAASAACDRCRQYDHVRRDCRALRDLHADRRLHAGRTAAPFCRRDGRRRRLPLDGRRAARISAHAA